MGRRASIWLISLCQGTSRLKLQIIEQLTLCLFILPENAVLLQVANFHGDLSGICTSFKGMPIIALGVEKDSQIGRIITRFNTSQNVLYDALQHNWHFDPPSGSLPHSAGFSRTGRRERYEMSGHGHSHHGGCDGDEHHDDTPEMGLQYSLYTKIDLDNVQCLNEMTEDSGKTIFKPWEDRLNVEKYVESDADEELLINIPFTGNVKLKGIVIIGGENSSHPSKMKLYKNRPRMTFDDTAVPADQEFDLHPDTTGTIEYSTTVVRFSTVHHLSIYFPANFGAPTTKLYYIGLKGEFTQAHRHGVTICSYEAAPNVADHKTELPTNVAHHVS